MQVYRNTLMEKYYQKKEKKNETDRTGHYQI